MNTEVDTLSLGKELVLQKSYKILDLISSSELSHIYTCIHIQSGEIYILKEFFPHGLAIRDLDDRTLLCRLPSNKEKFQEMREAFIQEAHILQAMNHAHIVFYVDQIVAHPEGILHHIRSNIEIGILPALYCFYWIYLYPYRSEYFIVY